MTLKVTRYEYEQRGTKKRKKKEDEIRKKKKSNEMKHPKHRTFIIFVGVAIFEKKKKILGKNYVFFLCVFKFWRGSKMLWRPPKNNRCQ